jgi:hypothetical protein
MQRRQEDEMEEPFDDLHPGKTMCDDQTYLACLHQVFKVQVPREKAC